jgi:phosphatidate phosphatase APP1
MVTAVPRLLLAAWNSFVRVASARRAVTGMPELYRRIATTHPDAPFVYVSTGAWNTAGTLRSFLARNGYPAGPLLLTDWGPTNTGWFRSGQEHKHASIDALMRVLPQVSWLLVGDDGQHDPEIYSRTVQSWPDRVRAVAIRELTPAQQVLAHGATTPTATPEEVDRATGTVPSVGAGDGLGLSDELERVPGILDAADLL